MFIEPIDNWKFDPVDWCYVTLYLGHRLYLKPILGIDSVVWEARIGVPFYPGNISYPIQWDYYKGSNVIKSKSVKNLGCEVFVDPIVGMKEVNRRIKRLVETHKNLDSLDLGWIDSDLHEH